MGFGERFAVNIRLLLTTIQNLDFEVSARNVLQHYTASSPTRNPTRQKGSRMMPPPDLHIYLQRRVTLIFGLLAPKVHNFMPLLRGRHVPIYTKIGSFLPRDVMHKRDLCRHAVSVRPSLCVSVTFMDHVKTNKEIFEIVSPPGSHAILVFFHAKRHSNIPAGTPLTVASNAGRVGRNRDSEPICLLMTLKQARCCKHGRRWTTATISQVVTLLYRWSYTAGIRPPSATRDRVLQPESDRARSRTIHNHDRSYV